MEIDEWIRWKERTRKAREEAIRKREIAADVVKWLDEEWDAIEQWGKAMWDDSPSYIDDFGEAE